MCARARRPPRSLSATPGRSPARDRGSPPSFPPARAPRLPLLGRKEEPMATERKQGGGGSDGQELFGVRLNGTCHAPAEAVYDLLADLQKHLEWGGRRQKSKKFRLPPIDPPEG